MPCLNEAETLQVCVEKARDFLERPASPARCRRRQRQHRRLAGDRRARRRPGRARRRARATAPRCSAASRRRAAATSSWATPTTATTSRTSARSSSELRAGADLVMGNRFAGGIEPGRDAAAAPLPRQPGAVVRRPPVLPQPDPRLPLRAARLPTATRSLGLEPAHHRHGVRQRDGGQGRRCRARRSPRCRPPCAPTAAAGRRTCAAGATAGGTCASCCSTARAGCSSYPGLVADRARPARDASSWSSARSRSAASPSTSGRCCTPRCGRRGGPGGLLRAAHEGLCDRGGVPPARTAARPGHDRVGLEKGLLVGAVLFLLGLVAAILSFTVWNSRASASSTRGSRSASWSPPSWASSWVRRCSTASSCRSSVSAGGACPAPRSAAPAPERRGSGPDRAPDASTARWPRTGAGGAGRP